MLKAVIVGLFEDGVVEDEEVVGAVLPSSSFIKIPLISRLWLCSPRRRVGEGRSTATVDVEIECSRRLRYCKQ